MNTVLLVFVMIFEAFIYAGILTLMEGKQKKREEKERKLEYRMLSEKEAREILRDLSNDMAIWPEETAAIDLALSFSWCHLDGPCEYGNEEIRIPEETEAGNESE